MSDDPAAHLHNRAPLELRHGTQPFIDRALETWWQRAGMLSQETTVQGQEL